MTDSTHAKPAYFMVQVKAKSLEELSVRYAQAAIASLMKLGGQMIAGTPAPTVLEGKWDVICRRKINRFFSLMLEKFFRHFEHKAGVSRRNLK
jgi:uncharacterized protein (DUF1330 family)